MVKERWFNLGEPEHLCDKCFDEKYTIATKRHPKKEKYFVLGVFGGSKSDKDSK